MNVRVKSLSLRFIDSFNHMLTFVTNTTEPSYSHAKFTYMHLRKIKNERKLKRFSTTKTNWINQNVYIEWHSCGNWPGFSFSFEFSLSKDIQIVWFKYFVIWKLTVGELYINDYDLSSTLSTIVHLIVSSMIYGRDKSICRVFNRRCSSFFVFISNHFQTEIKLKLVTRTAKTDTTNIDTIRTCDSTQKK